MTRFRYRATDAEGNAFVDIMEADSARQATVKLQERGLTVNLVEEVDRPRGLLRVSKQLSWDELHLFTQQLHAITRTNLPLPAALRALAADLKNSRLRTVLEAIQRDVEQGISLHEAVERRHEAFPPLFSGIIRAGEATGNLSGVLQLYLHHTERMMGLKDTLKTALAYPVMVVVLGILVMVFLLIRVMPVFSEMYSEFGGELPAPTRFWIQAGFIVRHYWPQVIIALVLLVIAGKGVRTMIERREGGRVRLDWLRLHMPVAGHLRHLLAVSRFARTLAMLLASGAPLLPSLELASAASGSPLLQRSVEEASLRVAGGERIADALAGTGFFSYHFCWLLGMGEERGEAEVALENAADGLENELRVHDRTLGVILAPALIVLVGLLIASLIISIYLPIVGYGPILGGV